MKCQNFNNNLYYYFNTFFICTLHTYKFSLKNKILGLNESSPSKMTFKIFSRATILNYH